MTSKNQQLCRNITHDNQMVRDMQDAHCACAWNKLNNQKMEKRQTG
jgi:hypothetical protein